MFSKYMLCLSVCLYPINVKTTEPTGPKFCMRPHMTPGKVYGCSKLQKVESKSFKFLKIRKIILINPRTFLYSFKLYKEKLLKDRAAQIKVEIEDGRETL